MTGRHSVHGVAVLVGAGAGGMTYRAAVTATAALAAGAFLLSFVALRDLAVMTGIAPRSGCGAATGY